MAQNPLTAAIETATQVFGAPPSRVDPYHSNGMTFSICNVIEDVVRKSDWNIGPLCGFQPRAISYQPIVVAKWDNISPADYGRIDAIVICPDPREGKVAFIAHR
jgi:hypothetical protein